MNSIEKLTKLQNAVGYKQGVVNPIAILGLFGEAGEVMNETLIVGDDLQTEYIKNDGVSAAKLVDAQKKKIRDGAGVSVNVIIPETNLSAFDIEVADALYYLNAIAIGRGKTLADYAEISYQKVSKKTQINIERTESHVFAVLPPTDSMVKTADDLGLQNPRIFIPLGPKEPNT